MQDEAVDVMKPVVLGPHVNLQSVKPNAFLAGC